VITISQLSLEGLATPAVMVTEGVLPKQTGDMADNVKLVKAAALSACANPTGKTANASNTVPYKPTNGLVIILIIRFIRASFKTCRWLMAAGELPSVH
jgi:hypothetical protein